MTPREAQIAALKALRKDLTEADIRTMLGQEPFDELRTRAMMGFPLPGERGYAPAPPEDIRSITRGIDAPQPTNQIHENQSKHRRLGPPNA